MSDLTISPVSGGSGTMSIGGTVTSGTTGSVLFVGSGPVLAQDNANFFWDDTNDRLGIGSAMPAADLEIMISGASDVGFIVQAAASQSGDLAQFLTSAGIKRNSVTSTGGLYFFNGQTETISFSFSPIAVSGTLTFDNIASGINGFALNSSLTYTAAPIFGIMPLFFFFGPTVNLSITSAIWSGSGGFIFQPTYASTNGITTKMIATFASFTDNPAFNVSGTGTYDNTSTYIGYRSSFAVGSGATWGDRTCIRVLDATGAGTVVSQIGLDIASLAKGGTFNYAIRTGASGEIRFGNKITLYNNIATVSGGVPSELATVDLTAQGAAIGATTIYTPAATGMFRVSIYLQVTRAATTSSILGGATGVVITYNDGDGNVAQTNTAALFTTAGAVAVTAAGNTTATNLEGTMVIYARTGVAIQYAVGYTSVGITSMQFSVRMKLEAL